MTVAIIDLDYVKYAAAAVGETRTIKAIHKESGREKEFLGKQDFWGTSWKKKDGGWLAELNAEREAQGKSKFLPEDFEIVEQQTITEPIENVLHTAKLMVESGLKMIGTDKYKAYLGKGDSFRVEKSTLLEYKANRVDQLKPLLLGEVTDYLEKKFKPEIVTGIEADDACVYTASASPKYVVQGIDKDYYGCEVNFFNHNRPEEGVVDCRGFGSLWRDDKNKVRGKGRLFKYLQMCSEDKVDNYKAHCFSDVTWGEVSAYKMLEKCKDDKDAFATMVEIFKTLYPEPKEVMGWRGDLITISWDYVMQEMMDMAHIHRKPNDFVNVLETLDKLKVKY